MRLFLDTEFSDFRDPRLLSVGIVAEDGREFYAELIDGWQRERCTQFVIDEVLPLLGKSPENQVSRAELKPRLIAWLESLGTPPVIAQFVFDSEVDWRLLLEACGNLSTPNLDVQWQWLSSLDPKMARHCEDLLEEMLTGEPQRHHALTDARALRQVVMLIGSELPRGK